MKYDRKSWIFIFSKRYTTSITFKVRRKVFVLVFIFLVVIASSGCDGLLVIVVALPSQVLQIKKCYAGTESE